MNQGSVTINGKKVPLEGEKNLLAVIRKAGIEMPTFCYHSELSVYGACRLCIADIEDGGSTPAVPPLPGTVWSLKTHTPKLRKMRKTLVELLLANHDMTCTTCEKSSACKLKELAHDLGVTEVPFKKTKESREPDMLSPSLIRNPDKCVLCGDCVRYCHEIQGVGAIDFAYRGEDVVVTPAFNKSLGPGGLHQLRSVRRRMSYRSHYAPQRAERSLGRTGRRQQDCRGTDRPRRQSLHWRNVRYAHLRGNLGKIMAALKFIGFKEVYDTSFGADLTVMEEAGEFLERKAKGENLPLFTSCCPGWVKYAEQFHPDLLPNLSSCMSPQGMVGSLAKKFLSQSLEKEEKDIVMVSIMPCTAKKVLVEKSAPS